MKSLPQNCIMVEKKSSRVRSPIMFVPSGRLAWSCFMSSMVHAVLSPTMDFLPIIVPTEKLGTT